MQNSDKNLLISVLLFGDEINSINFIKSLNTQLVQYQSLSPLIITLVIRNNMPVYIEDDINIINTIHSLQKNYYLYYETEKYNVGFGLGHNITFEKYSSDYLLVLNNDIFFPHVQFIDRAIAILESETDVALVGPLNAPKSLNAETGSGFDGGIFAPQVYAEGSILFVRSSDANKYGLFDSDYRVAYFEDSDLSFRMQQAGRAIRHVHIEHQHYRSHSSKRINRSLMNSIFEGNRAEFFKKWRSALKTQSINRQIAIDLFSDGIGDLVACLPNVFGLIANYQKLNVEIHIHLQNSTLGFLYDWIPDVKLITQNQLITGTYDTIYSLNQFPYQLPFNMQILYEAFFGPATQGELLLKQFKDHVIGNYNLGKVAKFTVVHCEYLRTDWEGRGFDLLSCENIEIFSELDKTHTLVLVGKEKSIVKLPKIIKCKVVDLRGELSLPELFAVVKQSRSAITIDSSVLHIAQLFDVPVFGFFGATDPGARMSRKIESQYWTNSKLDCLGCYHRYLEPGYNKCVRKDQACLILENKASIANRLCEFVNGRSEKRIVPLALDRLQTDFVKLLTFNPIYKHKLFAQSHNGDMSLANILDSLLAISRQGVETQLTAKFAELTERTEQLQAENYQLRSTADKLKRSSGGSALALAPARGLRSVVPVDEQSMIAGASSLRSALTFQNMRVIDEVGGIMRCQSSTLDPIVIITEPIPLTKNNLRVRCRLRTDHDSTCRVYLFSTEVLENANTPFMIADASAPLLKGENIVDILIKTPQAKGQKCLVRFDPVEYPGEFEMFGLHLLGED